MRSAIQETACGQGRSVARDSATKNGKWSNAVCVKWSNAVSVKWSKALC